MGPATRPDPPARRRWWRLLWLVVPALLVAAFVAYGAFTDYVERDPRFCAQCHPAAPDLMLWTRSQHRKIICQSCHHESSDGAVGILMEFAFKGTNPDGSSRGPHTQKLVMDSCATCHLSHDRSWPQIGQSTGHVVHVNREGQDCLRCHGESIHGVRGPVEVCRECHADHSVAMDKLGDDHCLACHNFLTTDDTLAPTRDRCVDCHKRRNVEIPPTPEGAPMSKMACGKCHRPHENASNAHVGCDKCHAETRGHGLHAHPDHGDCLACHQPHTWDARQTSCLGCHKVAENHHRDMRCWSCHGFGATAQPGLKDVLGPGSVP